MIVPQLGCSSARPLLVRKRPSRFACAARQRARDATVPAGGWASGDVAYVTLGPAAADPLSALQDRVERDPAG